MLNTIFNTIKDNWKRYLISSAITFIVGAITILLAQWANVTLESFKDGTILTVLFLAVRGGIKLTFELILTLLVPLVVKK